MLDGTKRLTEIRRVQCFHRFRIKARKARHARLCTQIFFTKPQRKTNSINMRNKHHIIGNHLSWSKALRSPQSKDFIQKMQDGNKCNRYSALCIQLQVFFFIYQLKTCFVKLFIQNHRPRERERVNIINGTDSCTC